MKKIIEYFVVNDRFTLVLTLFVVIAGCLGLFRMKAESYPSVSFASATITTQYPGAGPDEVEAEVTRPLEDEIRGVSGLKDVTSISQSGKSIINVRVDMDHYNVDKVMDDLQKAVNRVNDLPSEVNERPRFVEMNSKEFPAIEFAIVWGPDANEKEKDNFALNLKDLVETNPNVLNSRLTGYQEREYRILLDQKKLDEHFLSISEVFQKIRENYRNIPAGNIEGKDLQYLVRIREKTLDISKMSGIYIRSNFSGKSVQLKDVASVIDYKEEPKILASVNGQDAILMIVTKKQGADTIKLAKEVREIIATVATPKGVKVLITNNEAKKVEDRLGVLSSNAVSGLALVLFFMFIFLPGKIGFAASMSLPVAMFGVLAFMPVMGVNFDAISILALVIALGMLVDNSVVISENFNRLRSEGHSNYDAVIHGTHQFWGPISVTAATTIAAFLPMLVTRGIIGKFIFFIPIIVSLSLALSLFESFFLLPVRLQFVGKYTKVLAPEDIEKEWFYKVSSWFEKVMFVAVRHRYIMSIGFIAILFGSIFMLVKVNKFILFPAEEIEMYTAGFTMPQGSTIAKTHEMEKVLALKIKEVLGESVENVICRSGVYQVRPNDPKARDGNIYGMAIIYVTENAKLNLHHTVALEKLRTIKIPELEELSFEANIHGPPVGPPVMVILNSFNEKQLEEFSKEAKLMLRSLDGLIDVRLQEVVGDEEIHLDFDYATIARLGLNLASIGETIKAGLEGVIISKININNKKVHVRLKLKHEDRSKMDQIKDIKVRDPQGNLIPISKIAKIRLDKGTTVIKHYNFMRSVTITADVEKNKLTSLQANQFLESELRKVMLKKYPLVTFSLKGEEESTQESMTSLRDAMVLSLIGIFGLLVLLFNSLVNPFIIMTTIPLGLVGFSIAFYFHDRAVSFMALIGVIGLGGIIVNSGIVLISFIEDLKRETKWDLDTILAKSSRLRLRAVVVSSLTTISGLFPTAYGIGGHDSMLVPLTLAMAWGLTSGTILTLIWIPCAYRIVEDVKGLWNHVFVRS